MLTFSKLERKGHLGNQLFQIASTIGIAVKNKQAYGFKPWSYQSFFKHPLPLAETLDYEVFEEQAFHYEAIELEAKHYDLDGWFQSEYYFDTKLTKKYFAFNDAIIHKVKHVYPEVFLKPTILISIRRGDFVDHPDYFQLPISYYLNALFYHFEDWEAHHIVVASDDIAYCKFHFSVLPNVYFLEDLSGIEQLCFASLCQHFIISNSTFSWWCAWLGEQTDSKIVRPLYNFTAAKNAVDNDKDYFPKRWLVYDHLATKIDLGNINLMIAHDDAVLVEYMRSNFNYGELYIKTHTPDDSIERDKALVDVGRYLLPPLTLSVVAKHIIDTQEPLSVLLKGRLLKTSKRLDYGVLKRQFDYGIFSRIFEPNYNVRRSKVICKAIPRGFNGNTTDALDVIGTSTRGTTTQYYSYAGTMGTIFQFKYYLAVQRHTTIRAVKKMVKTVLNIRRS
ncbi:alpha-1,2-fucosyltransferase [Meridianimaribacter sp. CL38]|uniref:alpha-1,2-fucosyltransferase n=1 Tax=Meridianimaribacter sp. CL38 TaxID=2213021 RepID=UPI001376363E|nr:alpha-1,2-fucosyltransferase [Meridianimaribacter sp. CL38]